MTKPTTQITAEVSAVKKIPEGRRFQPGQSGNPKGRPKTDDSWKNILSSLLDAKDVTLPDGTKLTRKQAIALRMIQEALKGRVEAANIIGKYTESPAPTKVCPVDSDEKPLPAVVFKIQKETLESWKQRFHNKQS